MSKLLKLILKITSLVIIQKILMICGLYVKNKVTKKQLLGVNKLLKNTMIIL